MDGTADEKTMLNYNNRTIEPIMTAIAEEMKRKFLTKTARTQKQSILLFKDPFRLVSVSEISEMADKFTRNEILSSNEIRQIIGMKPSTDPKADELNNANINKGLTDMSVPVVGQNEEADYDSLFNDFITNLEGQIGSILGDDEDADDGADIEEERDENET